VRGVQPHTQGKLRAQIGAGRGTGLQKQSVGNKLRTYPHARKQANKQTNTHTHTHVQTNKQTKPNQTNKQSDQPSEVSSGKRPVKRHIAGLKVFGFCPQALSLQPQLPRVGWSRCGREWSADCLDHGRAEVGLGVGAVAVHAQGRGIESLWLASAAAGPKKF